MDISFLKNTDLLNNLQNELVGKTNMRSRVLRINSGKPKTHGEIYLSVHLQAWRELIELDTGTQTFSNILEYYLHRKKCLTDGLSREDILKQASQLLIDASKSWPISIEKCFLCRNVLCLFFSRKELLKSAIMETIRSGSNYGRRKSSGRSFCFKINEDKDSDLTTMRLRLIKQTTESILALQGCEVANENADCRYSLTTKSQGPVDDDYRKYVCGVVMNQASNAKETHLTYNDYVDQKVQCIPNMEKDLPEENLLCIAQANAIIELLSVKPSKPVFLRTKGDSDEEESRSQSGAFILYNAVRINRILEKYAEEECLGNYPKMWDINDVDFSLLNQEEEWDLVHDFIHGYPHVVACCVRHEESLNTSPHMICLFLSRLSKKFSAYYQRTRILTGARDHLIPTMQARLYLLRALQIVVNNSLAVLNIVLPSQM